MNRRTFFSAVAAAPALTLIRPGVACGRTAQGQGDAGPHLQAARPEPALQSEQHGRDGRDEHRHHRHRRRRDEGHARAVRRHAHRPESVPHRGALAGGVYRVVLSAGPRESARTRRAGSRVVGHQGESAWPAGSRTARRRGPRLLRVLRDRRRDASRARRPGRA